MHPPPSNVDPMQPPPSEDNPLHPLPPHTRTHPPPSHDYPSSPPTCSANGLKSLCLEDKEYPLHEIQNAIQKHHKIVIHLYAEIAKNSTQADKPLPGRSSKMEEHRLCPSNAQSVLPLRAQNKDGKWRIIINNIKAYYTTLTQTVHIEECQYVDEPCRLLPHCYDSKCVQKSVFHRFLVYDPYDKYFPFAIDVFKIPVNCACYTGEFTNTKH
ncbi:UNVERIFIED_CONTAM: hypothetical protein GTU68_007138 [Idotea baltica]|nr:hypothetical protein [Idotea baltica]